MVLVTSACGNVASRVMSVLIRHGISVKALDINPNVEKAVELGATEAYVGDVHDPDTFKNALEGCDQVLYQPTLFDPEESELAANCIDAAVEAGVRQFVMLSVVHPGMSTLLQHTMKLKAEEHLIYKGLTDNLNYTILEPTHYFHNFDLPYVVETDTYDIFYDPDTKLAMVDAEDVGEVAAKVLTEDGHQNATYELVGDTYLSTNELMDVYNKVTGKNAIAVYETDPKKAMKAFSRDDWDAYPGQAFLHLAETYSKYGIAGNSNVLTWLLGRKPTSFEDWIRRELDKLGK